MRSSRAGFWKKALTLTSYAAAGAIIAFWTAYMPASAGNILTKLNISAKDLVPVFDASGQGDKSEQFRGATFDERWDAVPAPQGAQSGDRKSEHETPRTGEHAEKIPFSCELAFSRLVTRGNFSTRCIASLDTLTTVIASA
jgi:hypothetical protein